MRSPASSLMARHRQLFRSVFLLKSALMINIMTAKSIGLTILDSFLLCVDEVVE